MLQVDRQDQLDVAKVLHDHLTRHLEEKQNELENFELNLASEREIAAAHLALDNLESRHHESHLRLEHLEDKVALHRPFFPFIPVYQSEGADSFPLVADTDPSKSEEENRIRRKSFPISFSEPIP